MLSKNIQALKKINAFSLVLKQLSLILHYICKSNQKFIHVIQRTTLQENYFSFAKHTQIKRENKNRREKAFLSAEIQTNRVKTD